MPLMPALLLAAATPAPLVPASKWAVDYGATACKLTREFKDEQGGTMALAWSAAPLAPQWTLTLVETTADLASGQGEAQVSVGSVTRPTSFIKGKVGEGLRSTRFYGAADLFAAAPEPMVLTVALPNETARSFTLPGAAAGIAALRACTHSLASQWGIDEAANAKVSVPAQPIGNEEGWLQLADYPSGEIVAGHQGAVAVLYTVATDGRIHDCRTVASSGFAALDRVPCSVLMRRARFKPARDAAGAPVEMQGTRVAKFFTETR